MKKISLRKRFKRLKWAIVIDPGHGGRDPGAVNKKYGYEEKDINLHVADYMREYINDRVPELNAFYTRHMDWAVSLPERCRFANGTETSFFGKKIDAFISIHTNARVLKGRYGLEIETYYFRNSEPGFELAASVQRELLAIGVHYDLPVIDRGVKVGQRRGRDGELKDFYVLRKTHMPAILVELGFLSDDEEAQLLVKSENQEIMAQAIVDGVVKWLEEKDG